MDPVNGGILNSCDNGMQESKNLQAENTPTALQCETSTKHTQATHTKAIQEKMHLLSNWEKPTQILKTSHWVIVGFENSLQYRS